jgi:cytochrome c oxidase subunit II
MMKKQTILTLAIAAIGLAAISWWVGQQAYSWFPPQASAESVLIDRLFSVLVTIGSFVFLGVVGALGYAILFQQAGKYEVGDGPPIEGNVPLEIVWTAIPFVLVMGIAFYSYQIYDEMEIRGPMEHDHKTAMTMPMATSEDAIEVIAKQWVWEFRYPAQNVTSTELHLPVNQRAHLILKAQDVIHGFYIPAFRLKQDMIPGQVGTFEFTPILAGQYRLRDSQYSGTYFAAMQANVVVESADDYQNWLTRSAATTPAVAHNTAFAEYNQKSTRAGWKTIAPAAPPIVNYSNPND